MTRGKQFEILYYLRCLTRDHYEGKLDNDITENYREQIREAFYKIVEAEKMEHDE